MNPICALTFGVKKSAFWGVGARTRTDTPKSGNLSRKFSKKQHIVVLISAGSEWRAVKGILESHNLEIRPTPFGESFALHPSTFNLPPSTNLIFLHGGWGKISAAATTQYAIDHFGADLLINLGTCGGLEGRIETGDILLVERTLVYDIIEQMSDPQAALDRYTVKLDTSWLEDVPLPSDVRPGLLVSADRDILREDVPMLIERFDAVAADWESGAIAWVADRNAIACLILRGVTDIVSTESGEAYGNIELFRERTKTIMARLLEILPLFLKK
ncbi:MAG: 5'-methylthioadenosine/S-adenosylhomocysteine nucleosidase [Anaerolineales bacterium]